MLAAISIGLSPHLLAMVLAFAEQERILAACRQAIELRFRLYCYGDAMLIL
ncbi:MAG: S-adenosylmethionine:tRNA ribosyltransferase-isomerase [Phycisphaerae bacterium]|nr:S-adenosylmethionine:tRNA ribosyltransferase-isomerase [Phycisphaerae bacterium]